MKLNAIFAVRSHKNIRTNIFLYDIIIFGLLLDSAQDVLEIVGYDDAIAAAQMARFQDPNTSHVAHLILRIDGL